MLDASWLPILTTSLLIFMARILDVSFGTIRIIYVTKGKKYQAALLGFIEILIWIIAINQVMKNSTNAVHFIAYAAGFATGNFVGISIEDKLALGKLAMQLISSEEISLLVQKLQECHFGVTQIEGMGTRGKVNVLFILLNRKRLNELRNIIDTYAPKAFYAISDVQKASAGVFQTVSAGKTASAFDFLRTFRQAK